MFGTATHTQTSKAPAKTVFITDIIDISGAVYGDGYEWIFH